MTDWFISCAVTHHYGCVCSQIVDELREQILKLRFPHRVQNKEATPKTKRKVIGHPSPSKTPSIIAPKPALSDRPCVVVLNKPLEKLLIRWVWTKAAWQLTVIEINGWYFTGMRSCRWTSGPPSFSTWRTFCSRPTVPRRSAWQPTGQLRPPWPPCLVTSFTSAGCGPCRAAKDRLWPCKPSPTSCPCSPSEFTHLFMPQYQEQVVARGVTRSGCLSVPFLSKWRQQSLLTISSILVQMSMKLDSRMSSYHVRFTSCGCFCFGWPGEGCKLLLINMASVAPSWINTSTTFICQSHSPALWVFINSNWLNRRWELLFKYQRLLRFIVNF